MNCSKIINTKLYKIALWNANGILNHKHEVELFLSNNKIDIMLVSESHLPTKYIFKIPHYAVYNAAHPDASRKRRAGAAIIIRQGIKHFLLGKVEMPHIQAANVVIEDWLGPLTISAAYCPPNYPANKISFTNYFNELGNRFIAGGDFNAKNVSWGSRLTAPGRGKILYAVTQELRLQYLSTCAPTYWPTDPYKTPDCLDFFIIKGINTDYLDIKSNDDIASDHTPVIATLNTTIQEKQERAKLYNNKTNWEFFRKIISDKTNLKTSLKSPVELENEIENFTTLIHKAAWEATPTININKICQ